jgi:hypothetical protein
MHSAYIAVTILAAVANGYAAFMNFVGAQSVRAVAARVHVSQQWMVPFGILLACGALGLLLGLFLPVFGLAAAIGLVVYFICALGAHMRVHDRHVGGAVSFLTLSIAVLVTAIGSRGQW